MGLSESTIKTILKPFACLTHCKITAKSPCCKWCCIKDECECNIDTHDYDVQIIENSTDSVSFKQFHKL